MRQSDGLDFFLSYKHNNASDMSDTQLKRKRSQRDKAPATTLPKRQKSAHLDQDTPTNAAATPKTAVKDKVSTPIALPQLPVSDASNALQVATTPGANKKTRRSRRKLADRVAVDDAQVVEKPQAAVDGKSPWFLSRPLGGKLIAHDPVFAQDERYAHNKATYSFLFLTTV